MAEVKRIYWEIYDPAKVQGSEEKIVKVFRCDKINSIYRRHISDKNGSQKTIRQIARFGRNISTIIS